MLLLFVKFTALVVVPLNVSGLYKSLPLRSKVPAVTVTVAVPTGLEVIVYGAETPVLTVVPEIFNVPAEIVVPPE